MKVIIESEERVDRVDEKKSYLIISIINTVHPYFRNEHEADEMKFVFTGKEAIEKATQLNTVLEEIMGRS